MWWGDGETAKDVIESVASAKDCIGALEKALGD